MASPVKAPNKAPSTWRCGGTAGCGIGNHPLWWNRCSRCHTVAVRILEAPADIGSRQRNPSSSNTPPPPSPQPSDGQRKPGGRWGGGPPAAVSAAQGAAEPAAEAQVDKAPLQRKRGQAKKSPLAARPLGAQSYPPTQISVFQGIVDQLADAPSQVEGLDAVRTAASAALAQEWLARDLARPLSIVLRSNEAALAKKTRARAANLARQRELTVALVAASDKLQAARALGAAIEREVRQLEAAVAATPRAAQRAITDQASLFARLAPDAEQVRDIPGAAQALAAIEAAAQQATAAAQLLQNLRDAQAHGAAGPATMEVQADDDPAGSGASGHGGAAPLAAAGPAGAAAQPAGGQPRGRAAAGSAAARAQPDARSLLARQVAEVEELERQSKIAEAEAEAASRGRSRTPPQDSL